MKNQIFSTNINSIERPIHELMDLNVKTIQSFTYMTPVEILSVRKPEEILEKNMDILVDNGHKALDYMESMFNIMEKHWLTLSNSVAQNSKQLMGESRLPGRQSMEKAMDLGQHTVKNLASNLHHGARNTVKHAQTTLRNNVKEGTKVLQSGTKIMTSSAKATTKKAKPGLKSASKIKASPLKATSGIKMAVKSGTSKTKASLIKKSASGTKSAAKPGLSKTKSSPAKRIASGTKPAVRSSASKAKSGSIKKLASSTKPVVKSTISKARPAKKLASKKQVIKSASKIQTGTSKSGQHVAHKTGAFVSKPMSHQTAKPADSQHNIKPTTPGLIRDSHELPKHPASNSSLHDNKGIGSNFNRDKI